ncbi:MAG: NAD(P)H-hydrate dehydratase [Chloroflexota bacterium]
MKVVTGAQMRQLEQRAIDKGMPAQALMQNAGRAVADGVSQHLNGVAGRRVLILVGPGNNGGDGLVAARHLHDFGALVTLYLWNRGQEGDVNLELARERGVPVITAEADEGFERLGDLVRSADVLVDSLLGTGKARPITGTLRDLLATVRRVRSPRHTVVALDLPSGLNPDDGSIDPNSLKADLTVTLGCPKLGLFLPPGAAYVGELVVGDIGMPSAVAQDIDVEMSTPAMVHDWLPKRPATGHKGTFGRALVVAGSASFVGAAYLVGAAAIRVGAGLVTLATPRSIYPILASKLTESTFLPLPDSQHGALEPSAVREVVEAASAYQAIALGPGLGQRSETAEFVKELLRGLERDGQTPLLKWVIDADGLNNLVQLPDWWRQLPPDAVLTPHPAELGRLLGIGTDDVQRNRLGCAREASNRWQKVVVLKGANTIIAAPERSTVINPGATAALATAGTGDVLTGTIVGLLAQGVPPYQAAVAGVYLHWQAAKAAGAGGEAGLAAGDLLDFLPKTIRATLG